MAKEEKKLKVGVFALTSCAGCQLRVLDLEDELGDIMDAVNITHFPIVSEYNDPDGPFDVAFVEGGVVRADEIGRIKKIRAASRVLIAHGTCATYGGVPSIKDFCNAAELEAAVYRNIRFLDSIEVYGIGRYVPVDYYLRGCPIDKNEFVRVLTRLIQGRRLPTQINYPVCVECRRRENECILQAGKLCMGPITYGGCDAACPSNGIPCYGCRGPLEDANVDALVGLFKERGLSKEDIRRMFVKFAGTSLRFKDAGVTEK